MFINSFHEDDWNDNTKSVWNNPNWNATKWRWWYPKSDHFQQGKAEDKMILWESINFYLWSQDIMTFQTITEQIFYWKVPKEREIKIIMIKDQRSCQFQGFKLEGTIFMLNQSHPNLLKIKF